MALLALAFTTVMLGKVSCHAAVAACRCMNRTMTAVFKQWIQKIAPSACLALIAGMLAAGASGLARIHAAQAKEGGAAKGSIKLNINEQPISREGRAVTSFAPVVKKVTPSVVKVFVTTKAKNIPSADFGPLEDPFFRRFFGDEFGSGGRGRNFQMPKQHGLGSGVVVSRDGYILTNNHVVDNADEVRVALSDGREFTAKVVGKDPKSDVAVVKVDAKDLPAIEIADSDKIEVGDLVLAIGNPFGVGQTVTMGIVSAKDRGNLGLDYEDFIQTDAAINPGNSGGALVDADGRLVGINTAILSRSGGNQGIGFAVPSNLARNVMEGLVNNGRVVRSYLGVHIQDLTPALSQQFDLKNNAGVVVTDVAPRSPAEKAGFKSGDVITELNGKPVQDSRHLKLQVAQTAPGSTVSVKVLRDGKTKTFDVVVKELPTDELASSGRHSDQEGASNDSLNGVTVSDIDSAVRQQFKLPSHVKGALVTEVDPNSPAYEAGLRSGDVIQEVDRKPVTSADDAVRLTENLKDKKILLRVWSQGGSRFVVVDESK